MDVRFLQTIPSLASFLTEMYKMQVNYRLSTPGQLAHVTPMAISAAMITGNPISQLPKNVYSPIQKQNIVMALTNLPI